MPVFPSNSAFPVGSLPPLVVTPQSDIMFAAPDVTSENPMTADNARLATLIASEINARADQVKAAVALLDEGATVPFIARYRKEATEGWMIPSFERLPNASSICVNSMRAAPPLLIPSTVKAR